MADPVRKKILIGDGEAWAVALFDQAARNIGVDVFRVLNGVDAIERFKTLAPALVVLDTLLPKLDGLQVAAKIHTTELGRITPIIITSAIYRRGPEVNALRRRFGFTDFLEKPFGLSAVERLLTQWLRDEPEAPVDGHDVPEMREVAEVGDQTVRSFSEMGIPRILIENYESKTTGIITLRHGPITKVLFFVDGLMTHALSNARRDLLGRMLLRNGWITKDDYDRARALQLESSGRVQLGSALVQLGVLNEGEVLNAVSSQILNIMFGLFSWERGEWICVETGNVPEKYRRFQFNPANIVFWGIRRLEGRVRFAPYLPSADSVIEVANSAPEFNERLNLTYFEEQLLGLANGKHRLSEIISIGRLAHLDVERVLYALLTIGVLRARSLTTAPEGVSSDTTELTVPHTGDLRRIRLATVLVDLHLAKFTGKLTVRGGDTESRLWLEAGEVVSAESSRQQFKLTDILLGANKITEAARDRAARILHSDAHRRIGAVLLELRALSLDELHWALRHQVQAIALHLLGQLDGTYVFEEGPVQVDFRVSIGVSTPNLVLEAARISEPPSEVVALLSTDVLLVKLWDDARVKRILRLSSAESRLVAFLEGGRAARETKSLGILDEVNLARSVHALLALGVIAQTGSGRSIESAPQRHLALDAASALGGEVDDEAEETIELGVEKVYERLRASTNLADENRQLKEALARMEAEMAKLKRQSPEG